MSELLLTLGGSGELIFFIKVSMLLLYVYDLTNPFPEKKILIGPRANYVSALG